MSIKKLFTSESVTEGHPDKLCDQISDSILDEVLKQDPNGRVACETVATTGMVLVCGEISTTAIIDIPEIVRETIRGIGYTRAKYGLDADTCSVLVSLDKQSPEISAGVDVSLEERDGHSSESLGAGDQGMMFGYACTETPELMPLPISLSHKLAKRLSDIRKNGMIPWLRPDGKTQVTVEYDEFNNPVRVDTVVISTQHKPGVKPNVLHSTILKHVIEYVIDKDLLDKDTKYFINPSGSFVVGGPQGDAGLTGRKIIVDTYGGYARHGGGAFSGKDATKVDRSGAYAARYVAKNIVGAGLAEKCEVQLAYAIGVAKPVSILVDTFGTGKVSEVELENVVNDLFNLTPSGIIEMLDLRQPVYKETSAYGHFGRSDVEFNWEKLDKVDQLKSRFEDKK